MFVGANQFIFVLDKNDNDDNKGYEDEENYGEVIT